MRSLVVMKWDGFSAADYDKVRKLVNWEGNTPKGAVFHAAAFNDKVCEITDIWESEEEYNTFVQTRLMPGMADLGIKGDPKVEIFPIHAIFAPDVKHLA